MKPTAAALVALALAAATPVLAQNMSQIARVRAGASCPGCNLFQADLGGLELKNRNYAGSRLRQADISLGVMNRSNFSGADMRDVDAYGAVLTGANFARANLTNAVFVGTHLNGANFSGANLHGTDFSGAEMGRAVGLTQSQLNQACGDEATVLPRGMRVRPCG